MEDAEEPTDQIAGGGSPGDTHTAHLTTAAPAENSIPRSRP
jgi:hypothetical protein